MMINTSRTAHCTGCYEMLLQSSEQEHSKTAVRHKRQQNKQQKKIKCIEHRHAVAQNHINSDSLSQ